MSASRVERTLIGWRMRFSRKIMASKIWLGRYPAPWSAAGGAAGEIIQRIEKKPVLLGTLDITSIATIFPPSTPSRGAETEMEIPITGKSVVLVTTCSTRDARPVRHGRAVSCGPPKRLQLCVLIDRGHRELPIEAAFIGRTVQTTENRLLRSNFARLMTRRKFC